MNISIRSFTLVLAMLLICAVNATETRSAEPISILSVRNAWRERRDALKEGTIQWKSSTTFPKGGMSDKLIDLPVDTVVPQDDLVESATETLTFDDNRMHFITENWIWSQTKAGYERIPIQRTGFFNGKVSDSLVRESKFPYPKGWILAINYISGSNNAEHLKIPLVFLRPLTEGYGFETLEQCDLSTRTVELAGRECAIMQRNLGGTITEEWYLDVNRGFIPLRFDMRKSGKIRTRVDIDYKNDQSLGWMLSSWNCVQMSFTKGDITSQQNCTITSYRINENADKSVLEFEFPVGTIVSDLRKKGSEDYLVLANGKTRRITRAEVARGATYKQLLNTESGLAGIPATPWWRLGLLWLAVGSLGVVAIAKLRRAFRRS